jgi:hypothetical protein
VDQSTWKTSSDVSARFEERSPYMTGNAGQICHEIHKLFFGVLEKGMGETSFTKFPP